MIFAESEILDKFLNSWPFATIVIVLILCVFFRGNLASLIERITHIGKDGVKTPQNSQQQNPASNPDLLSTSDETKKSTEGIESLMKAFDSKVLLKIEERTYNDLKKHELDVSGYAVKVLVRHYASDSSSV